MRRNNAQNTYLITAANVYDLRVWGPRSSRCLRTCQGLIFPTVLSFASHSRTIVLLFSAGARSYTSYRVPRLMYAHSRKNGCIYLWITVVSRRCHLLCLSTANISMVKATTSKQHAVDACFSGCWVNAPLRGTWDECTTTPNMIEAPPTIESQTRGDCPFLSFYIKNNMVPVSYLVCTVNTQNENLAKRKTHEITVKVRARHLSHAKRAPCAMQTSGQWVTRGSSDRTWVQEA